MSLIRRHNREYLIPEKSAEALGLQILEGEVYLDEPSETTPSEEALEHLDLAELRSRVNSVLETLPEKHAEVIRARYGIDQERETLREIGMRFGCTPANVRGIEMRALRALRHPDLARQLEPFIEPLCEEYEQDRF